MSASNGTTVSVPEQSKPSEHVDSEQYRPEASTSGVQNTIARSLGEIVTEAAHNATNFVVLANHYDHDKGTAVRYGHLVDATECLEIALTYLGILKSTFSHRLRMEDGENIGPWSDPQF